MYLYHDSQVSTAIFQNYSHLLLNQMLWVFLHLFWLHLASEISIENSIIDLFSLSSKLLAVSTFFRNGGTESLFDAEVMVLSSAAIFIGQNCD